jgi:hypothetical protein
VVQDDVGFEAAFGPLKSKQKTQKQEMSSEHEVSRLEAESIRLQDLWDAPSHVLPPPSLLAGPSLEAMLAAMSR